MLINNSFVNHSMFLYPIKNDEIITAVVNLSNSKAIGTDDLMPLIIKQNASLICKQFVHIYNLSFNQGIYPKLLKNAIVIPIFKGGSRDDLSNYRPISILTIFSKLIEKLFLNRLISFVEKHNILHSNQFDFKKNNYFNGCCTCTE